MPELVLIMIGGKVSNAISDNRSVQKCYIYGTGPKDMNNLNMIKQRPIIDLSTLSFVKSNIILLNRILFFSYVITK